MLPDAMLAPMSPESNKPSEPATTLEHSPGAFDATRPLVLSASLHALMLGHLRSWLPNEGCGLLASLPEEHGDRAVHFFPGTNIDRSPVRYTMDPAEVIDAMKRMREAGWDLAAIVHSHPRSAPVPSVTDRREAYYPEARLVIVSFAEETPSIEGWRLIGDREAREFRPATIVFQQR